MAGCGVVVHSWVVRMVRSVGVFFGGGVVAMGTVGVTMLHPQGSRNLKLPSPPEEVSPSWEDSSRMVCKEGDPLCTIPTNMAAESSPLGERLKWSMVNSKLPKHMGLPGVNPPLTGLLPLATNVSFSE
jgi:hypothetical protein